MAIGFARFILRQNKKPGPSLGRDTCAVNCYPPNYVTADHRKCCSLPALNYTIYENIRFSYFLIRRMRYIHGLIIDHQPTKGLILL